MVSLLISALFIPPIAREPRGKSQWEQTIQPPTPDKKADAHVG